MRYAQERIAIQIRNDRNDQLRLMYLMQDRTTVFTCIYECARKHHKQFATDLITWCDLSSSGFPNARDGPRAWGAAPGARVRIQGRTQPPVGRRARREPRR